MERVRIFDLIFGESLHSEVIKKSYSLINFLYNNGKIKEREIDIIWDCATKKHEAYKAAILKALTNLVMKVSLTHTNYIFNKVKSMNLSEIDKFCINLIRQISRRLSLNDLEKEYKNGPSTQNRS